MPRRTRPGWPLALAACLSLSACSFGSDPKRPTVTVTQTVSQAGAAADQAVHQAAASAGVEAHLTRRVDPSNDVTSCLSSDSAAKAGMVQINRDYFIEGVSPEQRSRSVQVLRSYWLDHGWKVVSENSAADGITVNLAQERTGLSLSLASGGGGIGISIQSGCLMPDSGPSATSHS
jgi:hypothetical protein